VFPNQLPDWARTHYDVPTRMVVQSCDRPYPYADCPPLAGIAVFQVTVARLPSHPTRRRTFTLD
jgi:hypothetical protein